MANILKNRNTGTVRHFVGVREQSENNHVNSENINYTPSYVANTDEAQEEDYGVSLTPEELDDAPSDVVNSDGEQEELSLSATIGDNDVQVDISLAKPDDGPVDKEAAEQPDYGQVEEPDAQPETEPETKPVKKPETNRWGPVRRRESPDFHGSVYDAPIDVFSPKLQALIHGIADGVDVPEEMVFGAILALASACMGRSRSLRYLPDWWENANLFLMIIGDSGLGKTPLAKTVFGPLKRIESEIKDRWQMQVEIYKRKLKEWAKESKKMTDEEAISSRPKKPLNVQYTLYDTTLEAMLERLEDNPRGMTILVDELNSYFDNLDRYSSTGKGETKRNLLQMWSSERITLTRKSNDGVPNETIVKAACVSMYCNIQPALLQNVFTDNDIQQGWPQRFLYIRARTMKPGSKEKKGVAREHREMLEQITTRLLTKLPMQINPETGMEEPAPVELSAWSKKCIDKFIHDLNTISFGDDEAHPYFRKMASMCLRLALIFHYLEWAVNAREGVYSEEYGRFESDEPIGEIEVSTVNKAIQFSFWFLAQSQAALRLIRPPQEGRPETPTNEIIMAKLILAHEEEIRSMGGMVPANDWNRWFLLEVVLAMKAARKALENLGVIFHDEHLEFPKETFAACHIIADEKYNWPAELNEKVSISYAPGKTHSISKASPEWDEKGEPPSISKKPASAKDVKPAAKKDFLAGPLKTYRRGMVKAS